MGRGGGGGEDPSRLVWFTRLESVWAYLGLDLYSSRPVGDKGPNWVAPLFFDQAHVGAQSIWLAMPVIWESRGQLTAPSLDLCMLVGSGSRTRFVVWAADGPKKS